MQSSFTRLGLGMIFAIVLVYLLMAAPLGRAVIGGLLFATPTTFFFVPIMYSWLRRNPPLNPDEQIARVAGETVEA